MVVKTRSYYSNILVILLFTLFSSLKNCECKNDEIDNYPRRPFPINTSSPLGPQLQGKTLGNFFTKAELQKHGLKADESIIIEQVTDTNPNSDTKENDEKKDGNNLNVTQIRALPQKGPDCGLHAIRNLLYSLKGFEDPKEDPNKLKYYPSMLDEEDYKLFQKSTAMDGPMSTNTASDILDKIKNKEILGIPEDSDKLLEKITSIYFGLGKNPDNNDFFATKAPDLISSIENLDKDKDKDKIDTIVRGMWLINTQLSQQKLFNSSIKELYNLATELPAKDKVVHGFKIVVGQGIGHAISVIMHKTKSKDNKDNIEFLLADSLNSNFKYAYQGSYLKAVEFLNSIISNQEYFKELLVRHIYVALYSQLSQKDGPNFTQGLVDLDNFHLKECVLYKNIYKEHFINLLNKCQHNLPKKNYDFGLRYLSENELKFEDMDEDEG